MIDGLRCNTAIIALAQPNIPLGVGNGQVLPGPCTRRMAASIGTPTWGMVPGGFFAIWRQWRCVWKKCGPPWVQWRLLLKVHQPSSNKTIYNKNNVLQFCMWKALQIDFMGEYQQTLLDTIIYRQSRKMDTANTEHMGCIMWHPYIGTIPISNNFLKESYYQFFWSWRNLVRKRPKKIQPN